MFHKLPSQQLVYDAVPVSGVFNTLDLSAYVPNDCVVELKVVNADAVSNIFAARPNGNTTVEIPTNSAFGGGCGNGSVGATIGKIRKLWVATTDAIVKIGFYYANAIKVYLTGYFDATIYDPTCAGAAEFSAISLSTSWGNSNIDITGKLGAARGLVLFEAVVSGTNRAAFRPSDYATDIMTRCLNGLATSEYNASMQSINSSARACICLPTGADGKYDAVSYSSACTVSGYVHAVISDYTHYVTSLGQISISTFGTDIDCSSVIGAGVDAKVLCSFMKSSLNTTNMWVGTREDASGDDTCPSTGYGGIDAFMLSGFDEHVPYNTSVSPTNGSTGQARDTSVTANFSDVGSDIVSNGWYMSINGATAYTGGSWQAGYGGSATTATISCSTHPDLPYGTLINCYVTATDAQGSSGAKSWSFTTVNHVPYNTSVTPSNGSTEQARDVDVGANFSDAGSDIDASTWVLTINGATAFTGGSWQAGYGGSATTSQIYCSTHPLLPDGGATISCYAAVTDAVGSTGTKSWSFTTVGAA